MKKTFINKKKSVYIQKNFRNIYFIHKKYVAEFVTIQTSEGKEKIWKNKTDKKRWKLFKGQILMSYLLLRETSSVDWQVKFQHKLSQNI